MSDIPNDSRATDPRALGRLTTEATNPASAELDRLDPLGFARLMHAQDLLAVRAMEAALPSIARAIEAATERLDRGGRLLYFGAGTSGRLGLLDAVECPPTFSVSPELVVGKIAGGETAFVKAVEGAEDSAELGAADVDGERVEARDVVVGIAASGRTPYVLGALDRARATGALTIALACNRESIIGTRADLSIEIDSGPEVLSGSTRLKAGTVTKLALNMLSTGVMVRLGKTFGNLMVDVQATNQKLVARSQRIVALAAGIDAAAAASALARAGGEVKTAIVATRLRIEVAEARARLAEHRGRVRAVLDAAEQDRRA
jgi:N-acetylmuramic acid 6-phosphate etherase